MKPAGEEWHFSLLPGTNRLKSFAEVTDPTRTIVGVADLKRHLAVLAAGERVFWGGSGYIYDRERGAWAKMVAPVPQALADDLRHYCRDREIRLEGPWP